MIRIGIDIHGVADADTAFFAELSKLLVKNGHEVHILTGSEKTPELEKYLRQELGLHWTHLFSITSHHRAAGTEVTEIRGNPHMDEALWNRAKAEYCKENRIQLHLDDSAVYGKEFVTPYAKYYASRRPVKKKKIAIIGGSFNPITTAHLSVAEAVLKHLPEIHQVWLMPAYLHPFRKHRDYASERIRMIRLAETDRIRYFGYEIDHRLSGVTYETFSRLLEDPDYRHRYDFHMVIGSDCVLDFDRKWRYAEQLARLVKFIIVPRPGYSLDRYTGLLSGPPHMILKDAAMPDISATMIRRRLRRGQPVRGLVPEEIGKFIMSKRLYQENDAPQTGETGKGGNVKEEGTSLTPEFFSRPAVTVDVAICTITDDSLDVLLIRRKHPPFAGCWSIPGGFLEIDREEGLRDTAARQLEAETGLKDIYIEQLKTYGNVGRYPRMRVITTAYFALVPYEKIARQHIRPAPDATEARWFSLKDYPDVLADSDDGLAFDHDLILSDLLQRIRGKISYIPIAFELVPEKFTWPELRKVYEIVLDKPLDATNFKRKIRSMYKIRELRSRAPASTAGRPPAFLRFEGMRDIYV
ncbi:hypothetical protein DENIS_1745 [Desulfonema ishimotonii]|uniref:Probable nicotinate-nucleotide adenylyltransferase n=1 Tax=Desulfonema ishimotonii TaxID=45657 RepID=A0A401FUZ2_9BACT|nr:nicotinate (nicotinamide) nucleotide adenylyltransferase [Desulfonema ishimotonii]GBC60786.1 hypothetical protein DENIS_1745 [Desulfonema ishimotonii]